MAKSKEELKKEAEELGVEAPEDYQELRGVVAEARNEEEAVKGDENPKEDKKEKSDREKRWEKFLEDYKLQNPAKYEIKKERGEFDKIPSCFN